MREKAGVYGASAFLFGVSLNPGQECPGSYEVGQVANSPSPWAYARLPACPTRGQGYAATRYECSTSMDGFGFYGIGCGKEVFNYAVDAVGDRVGLLAA